MGLCFWGSVFQYLNHGNLYLLGNHTRHSPRSPTPLSCVSKLVENCVCLLRNLSYQVHREIPQAERYQEAPPNVANNTGPHAASCFGAKKGKGESSFFVPCSLM